VISGQPFRSALAFIALAAHNAEEAVYARQWVLANADVLSQYTGRNRLEIWAGPAFRLSLLGLTLALLILATLAARARQRGAAIYLLLGVLAVFVANAVIPHIAGALALRAYVPGVATAILLVIPVSAWVYVSTIRDGFATRRGALVAAAVGTSLYAAAVGLLA